MSDDKPAKRAAAAAALRGLASGVGQQVSDRVRQELAAQAQPGADPDPDTAKRAAAAAVRGLVGGVGQNVADRVRQELGAVDAGGDPQPARRAAVAAAALGGLVGGVGQNVADLVRQEFGAARTEAVESAKAAARGAGLLGGAAATGNTAVLFVGVAVWRGLGNRIGFAKSALVVAGLAGTATAVLASNGVAELARVQGASRRARRRDAAPPPSAPTPPPAPTPSSGSRRRPATPPAAGGRRPAPDDSEAPGGVADPD